MTCYNIYRWLPCRCSLATDLRALAPVYMYLRNYYRVKLACSMHYYICTSVIDSCYYRVKLARYMHYIYVPP